MRISHTLAAAAILALAAACATIHTQAAPAQGVLVGTLRDSATGRPLVRGAACVGVGEQPLARTRCAHSDTAGAFRLDSIPPGRHTVQILCRGMGIFAETLASVPVEITGTAPVRRDIAVATTPCDPRVQREVTGVFSGYFTTGFEESRFVPCAADRWFVPGDSVGTRFAPRGEAWVAWRSPEVSRRIGVWPSPERTPGGSARFFVRWRGTAVGPGHFGHLGGAPFVIQVDSVLEARTPSPGDCS